MPSEFIVTKKHKRVEDALIEASVLAKGRTIDGFQIIGTSEVSPEKGLTPYPETYYTAYQVTFVVWVAPPLEELLPGLGFPVDSEGT